MKISFGDLERIRRNPKALNVKVAFWGGRSKFMRWQDAVKRYHVNENLGDAERYLEFSFDKFADNAANKRDLTRYINHLAEYAADYKMLGSEIFEFRKNMAFGLPLGYTFSGQIPRIDINIASDGYSIYFFAKEYFQWDSELRFPVLQEFISQYFDCDSSVVNVGVYILNDAKHYLTSFSRKEIDEANDELQNIIIEVDKASK